MFIFQKKSAKIAHKLVKLEYLGRILAQDLYTVRTRTEVYFIKPRHKPKQTTAVWYLAAA